MSTADILGGKLSGGDRGGKEGSSSSPSPPPSLSLFSLPSPATEQDLKDEGDRASVDLEHLSDDDDEEEELRRREIAEGKTSELAGSSSTSGAVGGGMGGAVSQFAREEKDDGDT